MASEYRDDGDDDTGKGMRTSEAERCGELEEDGCVSISRFVSALTADNADDQSEEPEATEEPRSERDDAECADNPNDAKPSGEEGPGENKTGGTEFAAASDSNDDFGGDPDGDEEEDDAEEADAEGGEEDADQPALPLDSVVEAILFASRESLKAVQIARAVGKGVRQSAVREAMHRLNLHYLETGRAFEIAEISGRFQLMSRPEFVQNIRRLYPKRGTGDKEKASRLTPAALDTLSIIAYKQPVTRGEIERIRGVGCGPVLRVLIERGTIKVAGKRADLVGQPLTYGTTDAFLVEFGLGSLDELPLRNEFLNTFASLDRTLAESGGEKAAIPDAGPEPEEEANQNDD